jgi:hypothetical protein
MILSNIRSDMCERRKRGSDLTLNTIPFNDGVAYITAKDKLTRSYIFYALNNITKRI